MLRSLVHAHLRSPLRGKTRLTAALAARFRTLQAVPVKVAGMPPVYVDLRDDGSVGLFADSPHAKAPWEAAEQYVMARFVAPGETAYDIGANRGLHLVALAARVGTSGRVVAFEPNPRLLPCLRRTVAALPNAALKEYALSDGDGEVRFNIPDNHEMASISGPGDTAPSPGGRTITCQARTIDSLVVSDGLPHPDFVKVDVEGAELRVFRGARGVLDRADAPTIMYESNVFAAPAVSGAPPRAATEFLAGLSRPAYRFFVIYPWGLITRYVPGQIVHENMLAVPAARMARWPELESAEFIRID